MSTQSPLPSTHLSDFGVRRFILIGSGLFILATSIAAPFVQWYLIMHATCGPSDMCGIENRLTIELFTLPCLIFAFTLVSWGIMQKRAASSKLYWPAILSCCFSTIAIMIKFFFLSSSLYEIIVLMHNMISLTLILSSFLACSIAVGAIYLTHNREWRQGRLLSVIALGYSLVLLVILCSNVY